MRVSSPRQVSHPDGEIRVECDVGGFPLHYQVPSGLPLSDGGEFLACAALMPAMMSGTELVLPDDRPLDPEFRDNLERAQDVLLGWRERWGLPLRRVTIDAALRDRPEAVRPEAMSFFSGGLDGAYTAWRNRDRLTRLVMLRGIDMQLENAGLWSEAQAASQRLADHWGLELVTIATNVRFLGYHHGFRWNLNYQGGGLASVAHLVPHRTALVAASHSVVELFPTGSHALLDPLWSSSTTRIEHDGAVDRTAKLAALRDDPVLPQVLRVCWHERGFNCGRCEKCVRTMVAMRLLGMPTPTFPADRDLSRLGILGANHGGRIDYIQELVELERQHPDPVIRRALARILRRERLRSVLRLLDEALGGHVARIKRRLRPPPSRVRASPTPAS